MRNGSLRRGINFIDSHGPSPPIVSLRLPPFLLCMGESVKLRNTILMHKERGLSEESGKTVSFSFLGIIYRRRYPQDRGRICTIEAKGMMGYTTARNSISLFSLLDQPSSYSLLIFHLSHRLCTCTDNRDLMRGMDKINFDLLLQSLQSGLVSRLLLVAPIP